MAQLLSHSITEFYASPWVLPNETIMSWLKWNKDTNVEKITITSDVDLEIIDFFNTTSKTRKTKSFSISTEDLESQGFFGFSARYNEIPSYELEIMITAQLFSNAVEIDKMTKKLKIVRPTVLVTGTDSLKIKSDSPSVPKMTLKIINSSTAEAIDVQPKIEIQSESHNAIQVITEHANSVLEQAPIRLLNINKYFTKIKIRRPCNAILFISLEYKDRLGNCYQTDPKKIKIQIETSQIKEVPITNVCQGDAEPVEIPLAPISTR